jgi:protein arginine kinase activator
MKCQFCSNPATVHLSDFVDAQKKELHLCAKCAEKHQLMQKQELNLPAIVKNLIGQHLGPHSDELARLTCPACGIKYMEFRAQGRLGCPHDYVVFRRGLAPLLQRIHRSERHAGKTPHRAVLPPEQQAERVELRRRLHNAIDREAYEEAAHLRDLLRQREATDESG